MTEELSLEEYAEAQKQIGSAVTDALDKGTAKMAFNVLHAYDLPHSVRGYLTHARTLCEVSIIWAVANGFVELTEKGRSEAEPEEPEDGQQSFSLPVDGGNVVQLHPSGGQYL